MRQKLKVSGAIGDLLEAINIVREVYAASFPIGLGMQDDIGRAVVADNFGDIEAKRAQILFTNKQRVNVTDMPTSPLYVVFHEAGKMFLLYRGPCKPVWELGYPIGTSNSKRVVRVWKIAELSPAYSECNP